MDKIKWLLDTAEKQPNDAGAWFWLGRAYEEESRWLDAIGVYTKGLGVCGSEELRQNLLTALSGATAKLQQGHAAAASITHVVNEKPHESRGAGEADSPNAGHIEHSKDSEDMDVREDDKDADEPDNGEPSRLQPVRQVEVNGHPGLRLIDGGKSRSDAAVEAAVPSITFEDVAGLKDLKKTIQIRIISPFYNQGLFSKFRKKTGGGVLLYGPPGCGKTFMARATAGECRAKFIPVHITDILDPYIGVSEQNLRDMFDSARSHKPSIMFFDEMDALGFNRAKSSGHMRGLVDTFLSEMEGIDTSTEQVLIMGATNMPWDVDNALKRPGRFDRLVFVGPPDEEARDLMFQLKMKGRYSGPLDTRRLAQMTEFYSGADIENVCERAAEQVLFEIMESGVERPIDMKDLEEAVSNTQASTMEWFRTAKNYVRYANQSGMYDDIEQYLKKNGKRL